MTADVHACPVCKARYEIPVRCDKHMPAADTLPEWRLLVTGSRDWTDTHVLSEALHRHVYWHRVNSEFVTVIHGGAKGADSLADVAAHQFGAHEVRKVHADWDTHGKAAGPKRNQAMLDMQPHHVLAFWTGNSKGTAHTIGEAKRRGIPLEVHWRQA